MFNSFRQHLYRFFNKEDAAESKTMHPVMNKRLFEILPRYKSNESREEGIEFFFYTDEEEKANNLAIELKALGYEIYGIYPPEEDHEKWSVTGCHTGLKLYQEELDKWSGQMIQVGYDNDCKFDGWGSLI